MNIRLSALAALGGVLLTTTANATVFYIDEFQITRNGRFWFHDPFDDGVEPPSSQNLVLDGTQAGYNTKPNPMPGPETNGKLALDTAKGEHIISQVTENPRKIQRARLDTNTSDADADKGKGLKEDHTFAVTGVYDLIQPEITTEFYGIELSDFKGARKANDYVQLAVALNQEGNWVVGFREANFEAQTFNLIDSYNLSQTTDLENFDQIALTLSKPSNADPSKQDITARFELIDLEAINPNLPVNLDGNSKIFEGESWTRADFIASVVPIPAALPLLGSALGLMGIIALRRNRRR